MGFIMLASPQSAGLFRRATRDSVAEKAAAAPASRQAR